MFEFEGEKVVAVNLIPEGIQPDGRYTPRVWTPGLQAITQELVFMLFTKNRDGVETIRVYPPRPQPDRNPPVFEVVPADFSPKKGKYISFSCRHFRIVRALRRIYDRAQWGLHHRHERSSEWILDLVKNLYIDGYIGDAQLEGFENEFEKLEKVIAMTSSDFEGERQNAEEKAFRIMSKIMAKIKIK